MTKLLPHLLILLLVSGCSTKPALPTEGVNTALTVQQVTDSAKAMGGTRVLWGGVIVGSTNLKDRTRLEILAYPLDSNHRPKTSKPAGSRFLAYQQGYLETVDYAAGRQVSMVGVITGTEEAQLGEHRYKYPAIKAEKIHLWPIRQPDSEPKVHFGFGILLHN